MFDSFDDFLLHGERTDEPIEIGDDNRIRFSSFDELDGSPKAAPTSERGAARDVELLHDLDELESGAFAG